MLLLCVAWLPDVSLLCGSLQRKTKHLRFLHSTAVLIQKIYRGYVARQWSRYAKHKHLIESSAEKINRVYRCAALP